MSMNIWAGPGDTVRFANPRGGRQGDINSAAKHLTIGEVYTVCSVDVSGMSSEVWLEGFDRAFNTCLFDDEQVDTDSAAWRAADFVLNPWPLPYNTGGPVHED